MTIHYTGKRPRVGSVLSGYQSISGTDLSTVMVIDLIGLTHEDVIARAQHASSMPKPRNTRVILITFDAHTKNPDPLTRYYRDLVDSFIDTLRDRGASDIVTDVVDCPAIVEELAPYTAPSSNGELYGSYPEGPLYWVTASDLAAFFETSVLTGESPRRRLHRISPTVRLTVPEALSCLTGRDPTEFRYKSLNPQVLADAYREHGLGAGDDQIHQQLPYYQHFVGQQVQ